MKIKVYLLPRHYFNTSVLEVVKSIWLTKQKFGKVFIIQQDESIKPRTEMIRIIEYKNISHRIIYRKLPNVSKVILVCNFPKGQKHTIFNQRPFTIRDYFKICQFRATTIILTLHRLDPQKIFGLSHRAKFTIEDGKPKIKRKFDAEYTGKSIGIRPKPNCRCSQNVGLCGR